MLPDAGEPAAIVVVRGDDQRGRVGEPLNDPLVVQVTDTRGRPVAGATVAFEFSSAGAGAAVVPEQKTTDANGEAETRLVLATTIGRQTGQARVVQAGGSGPIQTTFSAMALPEDANTMAAVAGQDQTGHVGLPLDDRLVVEVTDGFGNPVAGLPISWAAVGGGTVSANIVETDEDGRSRVDRVLGPTVGQQSTVASSEGLAGSPVTFSHTAIAGDASRLVILSGNDQTAEAGTVLPADLVVQLIDGDGNGVPQTAVSWVVATGGGSATPEITSTDGEGRTSTKWTLGGPLGQQRLDAVVSGVGVAAFRATATAGAPAALFIRTQPSSTARNGVRLARQPVVQLQDGRGNDVATAGVEVTASLGGGGELGGTLRRTTDATGKATFDDLSISGAPGPRTLVFQAVGYAQVTSDEIELEAIGTTTTITGDSPDPSVSGTAFTVSFRVASGAGTPGGSVTVTVSGDGPTPSCTRTLNNGSGSCELTLNNVGDRTLTASYSGGSGFSPSSDTEAHTVTSAAPSNQPPTAEFATTCDDLDCRFEDQSSDPDGEIDDRQWNFGDGETSDRRDPDHEFPSSGTYQVSLTVTDNDGATATVTHGVTVSQAAANTSTRFEVDSPDPTIPGQPFTVTLSVRSGDATPQGTATVSDGVDGCTVQIVGGSGSCSLALTTVGPRTLTATYQGNSSFATSSANETHMVNPPPPPNQPPTAEFSWQCDDLDCEFDDESNDSDGDIERWEWTFGDGGTSDNRNPSHVYTAEGTYVVIITVTDDDGATAFAQHSVTVNAPNQEPTADFTWTCTDLECQFTGQGNDADGSVSSWSWDFDDGESSPIQSPTHTFPAAETYEVRLTVTDNEGASRTVEHDVSVSAPSLNQPPTAEDDVYSTPGGGVALVVASPGVLGNDRDPDGTALSAQNPTGQSQGAVELNNDGSFTYTPNPGAAAQDTFTYESSDGSLKTLATVTINITP